MSAGGALLLGVYVGIASDNKLLTVHVALMLPGFVTLAIYGCIFRLWPAMKKAPLAQAQFWIATVANFAIVVGAYLFVVSGSVPIVAIDHARHPRRCADDLVILERERTRLRRPRPATEQMLIRLSGS